MNPQEAAVNDRSSAKYETLRKTDPYLAELLDLEWRRQQNTLELIASENHVSRAVMEATGSLLTNKYAEGYPGRRYYGGCEIVDKVEQLAIDRAKELFGAEHVNVQPHSGSQANMAVYFASLAPGDTLMAMSLAMGGHLTHGYKLNFSGKLYNCVHYGVNPQTEQIDFDEVAGLVREHKPKMILMGASAYPRTIHFDKFAEIAAEVGALLLADMAHIAGLVAAKLHPDPVPICDFVTTTTHKTLRGPRAGSILCKAEWAKRIDMAVFPGMQGGPLEHVIAGKAAAFGEALRPEFLGYQKQIMANAAAMADEMQRLGYRLVSGGTDNHLFLVDLTPKQTTGRQAETALEAAGIIVNKNLIPFDKLPARECSGIRIGSPALTTRGLKEDDMRHVARLLDTVLTAQGESDPKLSRAKGEIEEICKTHPLD
ncbi:MAG: aminotransferase class I/II-fold pyridoxal phosphate-dependent enzyme [Anaerolineaceae bacterium]|nr:aminotransferase class I/II-fold pyridoxal phosphate-dependent enzyme [Anaerolineaceae bacterium]